MPFIQLELDEKTWSDFKKGCIDRKTNMSKMLRADIDRHLEEWGQTVGFVTTEERPKEGKKPNQVTGLCQTTTCPNWNEEHVNNCMGHKDECKRFTAKEKK